MFHSVSSAAGPRLGNAFQVLGLFLDWICMLGVPGLAILFYSSGGVFFSLCSPPSCTIKRLRRFLMSKRAVPKGIGGK